MLAIAEYQLDVLHDPIAARTSAETLVKRYATGDAAPMGYVIAGRATLALDPSPVGLDSALASFDRVPRLFPRSEAVAPSLYYAAEIDRRAGRPSDAIDKLRRVAQYYPRSTWAARASLLESPLLLADGQPKEAMRALQRVVRRYGSGAEASTARAWNTTLYRLYVRAPAQPPYVASGRSIAGAVGQVEGRRGDCAGAGRQARRRDPDRRAAARRKGRGLQADGGHRARARSPSTTGAGCSSCRRRSSRARPSAAWAAWR